MKRITNKDILDAISSIKRKCSGSNIRTNYLPLLGHDQNDTVEGDIADNTVIFLVKQGMVDRVVFYSSDNNELINMLRNCPTGLALDYVSKTKDIPDDFLIEAGFRKIAVLQKLIFHDVIASEYEILNDAKLKAIYFDYDKNAVTYAKNDDVDEIHSLLESTFNKYIDHLPAKQELLDDFIKKNGMLVYRSDEKIQAIVGYTISGTRMFWMYAINNSGDYRIMNAMAVKSREIALTNNIKHVYTFLELSKKRSRAMKYYCRRGTEFVDFYNHIYANCDID